MLGRCAAIQGPVHAMLVVVIAEGFELSREVNALPEKRAIQEFAPDRADQSLDVWMRDWDVGNGLDLLDLEHAQVGEPTVEAEQRVVIGADPFGKRLAEDRVVEHPANRYAVRAFTCDPEANDAAGKEVQGHQHPVTAQQDRLATEQIQAPEAILRLRNESQPGSAFGSGITRPVVLGGHSAHDILVDLDAEDVGDLLRDTNAA